METPAKTTSNRYPAAPGIDEKNVNGAAPTDRNAFAEGKKPLVPSSELPSPKAIAKPTAQ